MRIPVLAGYRELDPAPRRFLMYVAINVVSWQNIIGPVMILFARKIDMPETLVGLLIAFMPFTTLLLLFTVPMIVRRGPKRVMMSAWLWRNVICCIVFLMPFALMSGHKWMAWAVLLLAVFGFSVMRALGAGGWLPWLHEIVSTEKRSVYFSTETSITQVINVAILFTQARLLAVDDPGIGRFLAIYGLGIAMGFISLLWMRRIPGGAGAMVTEESAGMNAYKRALSDRSYLVFLLVSIFSLSGMAWYGASFVMYMRDILGFKDSMTMSLTALGSFFILLTVGSWARFTEVNGSGLAMAKTLFGHTLAPLVLMLPAVYHANTQAIALISVSIASIFAAAFGVAVNRAMLNQAPDHDRIGYTALWTVSTALVLAITPLAAGLIIEWLGPMGFIICFCCSAMSTFAGAFLCLIFIHDRAILDRKWTVMFNPLLPLRTAGRIIWITIGLHETNRGQQANPTQNADG